VAPFLRNETLRDIQMEPRPPVPIGSRCTDGTLLEGSLTRAFRNKGKRRARPRPCSSPRPTLMKKKKLEEIYSKCAAVASSKMWGGGLPKRKQKEVEERCERGKRVDISCSTGEGTSQRRKGLTKGERLVCFLSGAYTELKEEAYLSLATALGTNPTTQACNYNKASRTSNKEKGTRERERREDLCSTTIQEDKPVV